MTVTVHGGPDNGTNLMEKLLMWEPTGSHATIDQQPREQIPGPEEITERSSEAREEIDFLFSRFISANEPKIGLRLGFDLAQTPTLGENWLSLDLEHTEQRTADCGQVSLDLASEHFDLVLCTGLDRVARPSALVAEIRRVLKQNGQVWAQAPVSRLIDASANSPSYWHFHPPGLQVLLEGFDEIRCAVYQSSNGSRADCFFYGLKPDVMLETTTASAAPGCALMPWRSPRPATSIAVACPASFNRVRYPFSRKAGS